MLNEGHCILNTAYCTVHTAPEPLPAPDPLPAPESAPLNVIQHIEKCTAHTTCLYCMLHIHHMLAEFELKMVAAK